MPAIKPELLRRPAAELFAIANLAFLAVDILLAHSVNFFHHWAEWIPFGFSLFSAPTLALAWHGESKGFKGARALGMVIGGASIAVGAAGLLWHLDSRFFQERSLKSLVYTAPLAAPLAYSGLGFLALLNRIVPDKDRAWAQWVAALALGGFAGNFLLTLADHAQNGFFSPLEWIPVGSSALMCAFLGLSLDKGANVRFLNATLALLAAQALIGLWGFALHAEAILAGPHDTLWENAVWSAPLFAPLLFVDLALLGAIGVLDLKRRAATEEA